MDEDERSSAARGGERLLHWWHLGALLGLISAVEGGRELLRGSGTEQMLATLPRSLYAWCPILAGVAIAIRRSDVGSTRAAVRVGLFVTLLMVALDVVSGLSPPPRTFLTARTPQGTLEPREAGEVGRSWVLTGLDWGRGELEGVGERIPVGQGYPGIHPRARAAEALYNGSLVLLVYGILGLVIAAGRWIRHHATFRKPQDERGAHLVVAWLLSPLAFSVTAAAADRLFHAALFRGTPVWAIPVPAVVLLALGLLAWIRGTRPPSDDEPSAARRT